MARSEKQEALDKIIKEYLTLKVTPYVEGDRAMSLLYRRLLRPANDILKAADGSVDVGLERIRQIKRWADSTNLSWALETVIKRWFENNQPKEKPIYTDENWKDKLEKSPEENVKVDKGIQSIKDILRKKGITR